MAGIPDSDNDYSDNDYEYRFNDTEDENTEDENSYDEEEDTEEKKKDIEYEDTEDEEAEEEDSDDEENNDDHEEGRIEDLDYIGKPIFKIEYLQKMDSRYLLKNPDLIHLFVINPNKTRWSEFLDNPLAYFMIKKKAETNINDLDWVTLTINKNTIKLLEEYPHKIVWSWIDRNEYGIQLIEKYINDDIINKLSWRSLSSNKNAINILKRFPHKIYLDELCENENIMEILEDPNISITIDHLNNYKCSKNKYLTEFLIKEENRHHINWNSFVCNEHDDAIELIKNNLDKITPRNINNLLENKNPKVIEIIEILESLGIFINKWTISKNPIAIDFLRARPNYIEWGSIVKNPNGHILLEKFFDELKNDDSFFEQIANYMTFDILINNPKSKISCIIIDLLIYKPKYINWKEFCKIANPKVILFLKKKKNIKKIDWKNLSTNSEAIYFLLEHKKKINFWELSKNEKMSHVILDYVAMTKFNISFIRELRKAALHPDRLEANRKIANITFEEMLTYNSDNLDYYSYLLKKTI